MKRSVNSRRHPGYSLIELMLVLALLSICVGVANQIFMECTVIERDALKAADNLVHADSLVRLIRSDVWGASRIVCDHPHQATLHMPDGSTVRWEVQRMILDEDETEVLIYRHETELGVEVPGDPQFAPADLSFRTDGVDLYLDTDSESICLRSAFPIMKEHGS